MGRSSFLSVVFFISGFLKAGAVWNLTRGDFYFLSLSLGFIYLIYNKASFLFEFRCIHFYFTSLASLPRGNFNTRERELYIKLISIIKQVSHFPKLILRPQTTHQLSILAVETTIPFYYSVLQTPGKFLSLSEEHSSKSTHLILIEFSLETHPIVSIEVYHFMVYCWRLEIHVVESPVAMEFSKLKGSTK